MLALKTRNGRETERGKIENKSSVEASVAKIEDFYCSSHCVDVVVLCSCDMVST